MKLILISTTAFLIFIVPVFSELTVNDLKNIRSIVKESEDRVKEHVDLKIENTDLKIGNVSDNVKEMDKRLNQISWLVIALIGFIAAVIGIPQIILASRGKEQKVQTERIERLEQQIGAIFEQINGQNSAE